MRKRRISLLRSSCTTTVHPLWQYAFCGTSLSMIALCGLYSPLCQSVNCWANPTMPNSTLFSTQPRLDAFSHRPFNPDLHATVSSVVYIVFTSSPSAPQNQPFTFRIHTSESTLPLFQSRLTPLFPYSAKYPTNPTSVWQNNGSADRDRDDIRERSPRADRERSPRRERERSRSPARNGGGGGGEDRGR